MTNNIFIVMLLIIGSSIIGISLEYPLTLAQTTNQTSNCDTSYPDTCIPPYPPDLNCADVADKNFAVLSPDPHGFDRDADGVGCES